MSNRSGYCKHGVYVGGIGIDWMCGLCEDGDDPEPTEADIEADRLAVQEQAWEAETLRMAEQMDDWLARALAAGEDPPMVR